MKKNQRLWFKLLIFMDHLYFGIFRNFLFLLVVLVHIFEYFLKPPEKYPYLYPLIYATFGFC